MTPKDKAKELVLKYYHLFSVELENTTDYREAKQCALIAVDLIIKDRERLNDAFFYCGDYWLKVKKEIEKL